MLLEFSVENYLSIKDRVTFSMITTKDKSLPSNYYESEKLNMNVLKSAVLYGANASGKTNVLKAIAFVVNLVRYSHMNQKGDRIGVVPFKLDEEYVTKPSSFEITFLQKGIKYIYGFTLDSRVIHEEYLYYYPHGAKATIFERKNTNEYKFTRDKEEQKTLSGRTLENVLYISSATQWNYTETSKAFEWFRESMVLDVVGEDREWMDLVTFKLAEDKQYEEILTNFLTQADLGIIGFKIQPYDKKKNDIDFINDALDKLLFVQVKSTNNLAHEWVKKSRPSRTVDSVGSLADVKTFHLAKDSYGDLTSIQFDLAEESKGTIKLFEMIGPIIDVLEHGRTMIIDEIDSSLHPLLTRFILELFHNPGYNKNNAQLICTTHDSSLLNLNIFRRDQIWFTEKIHEIGSTDLYSLSDLQPRKDENIRSGYLAGRYGAIPVLNDTNLFIRDDANGKNAEDTGSSKE